MNNLEKEPIIVDHMALLSSSKRVLSREEADLILKRMSDMRKSSGIVLMVNGKEFSSIKENE